MNSKKFKMAKIVQIKTRIAKKENKIIKEEEKIDIDKMLEAQGAKRAAHINDVSTSEIYPHCEGINGNWGHAEIIPVETSSGKFGYMITGTKRDQSVIDAENKQILEKMEREYANYLKRHKNRNT